MSINNTQNYFCVKRTFCDLMKIKIKSNYFPGRHESIKTTFRFKISRNNRVVSLKNMSRPFIFHHVKGSPLSEENFVIAEEHFTDALRP